MQALTLLLMSFALYLASFTSFAELRDSDLIEAVKNARGSTLEKDLPNLLIKDWVKNTFEKGAEAKWEVNDCGEGSTTTNPGTPICVELQIPQKNGYYLHINSIIGMTTEQEMTKPHLWMVYFYKGEGYKTIDVIHVRTINEAILFYQKPLGRK